MLRANSPGHLEQVDSYTPSHQISFGNLDYVADIRGDLIFQGIAPPTYALALDPESIARSEDELFELAKLSTTLRPIVEEPEEVVSPADMMGSDPSPDTGSESSEPMSHLFGQGVSLSPYSTGSLLSGQTLPLSEAPDLMRSLVITKEQHHA